MQNPASNLIYFAIEILCDKSGEAVQNIKSSCHRLYVMS